MENPAVCSDFSAAGIDKITGHRMFSRPRFDHTSIIAVRHEAYILTVRFFGTIKPAVCRDFSSRLLSQSTKREKRMG